MLLIAVAVVRVDEISFANLSPLQENIILACQRKFRLSPETRSFPPDQIYVAMMELCPLWVHGRPIGRRLYLALWCRMSDRWFANSEQGLFTWLALALKQEVYVHCHMRSLLPVKEHAAIHSAILDSLDVVYDESSGVAKWRARFCLEDFDVISVTGSVSYLIQIFSNPRPLPVNYLRHVRGVGQQLPEYPVNFS